ncbi:MAG TPA: M48 family metallopeptidase [Candidatus Binatia bacterium]|nr:M48 family metallopeptidase [Candidatus Binatia bacterium]
MKSIKQFYLVPIAIVATLISGCVVADGAAPRGDSRNDDRRQPANTRQIDSRQAERFYRIMTPLLKNMDRPKSPKDVRIGIIDEADINAANAGGGEFYVTTGLLEKANDEQLRGIMAHEIAHDDLGHVAKAQGLGVGLNLGVILLEQLIPGSSAVTPIAGSLIARGYSRNEEYAADRHGVEILRRAGYSKDVLINALNWVSRSSGGGGGGGFLSTHPATEDRIAQLEKLR